MNTGLLPGIASSSPKFSVYIGAPWWITSSRTVRIPTTGIYRISALGAGGSGAVVVEFGANSVTKAAAGGAGGGFCEGEYYLTAGTLLVITIGAGGAFASISVSAGGNLNGNAGGTTSVVGGPVALFAFGGQGGTFTTTAGSITTTAKGGSATGGNTVNANGGDGGSAKNAAAAGPNCAAGGGGAGSPYGDGGAGGSVDATGAGEGAVFVGGGGSVDGGSPPLNTGQGASAGSNGAGARFAPIVTTGFSGVGANGLALSSWFSSSPGANTVPSFFDSITNPFRAINGSGAFFGSSTASFIAAGAACSGHVSYNDQPNYSGAFAGIGGLCYYNVGGRTGNPGKAGWGGGTGGAVCALYTGSGNISSANAGNGVVLIERIG